MESKVNYSIVGAFVIALIGLLVFFIVWLTGASNNKKYHIYLVLMDESVSGLTNNSPVKYNGVTVGNINSISLNVHNPNQVRLLLDIEEGTPIKEDTRATLMSQGLTGLSYVNLTGGSVTASLLKSGKDEAYPVIKSEPSLMFRLDSALRQVSVSLTELSQDMRDLLDKNNRIAVKHTLQNLDKISATLASNAKQIDASLKSTQLLLKNAADTSTRFPAVINNLNNASVGVIAATQKLTAASTATKELAQDLKQNPAMLIRGRQPLKPGPGE